MLDEYNNAIEAYHQKWHKLVDGRKDKAFFKSLQPTSIGWKTADRAEFNERALVLRDLSDQVHYGWVNERWLATFHLKGLPLTGDIALIKLMQRRPGSTDAVGLDHIDYFIPTQDDIKPLLDAEPNLQWTEERNGDNCRWISLWFDKTEAKLRRDTVLEVCAKELRDVEAQILKQA
jgi:hypothetical protein